MLPDKFPVVVDAVRTQVRASVWQFLDIGAVANHDDANVKSIIDSLWGPKWDNLTFEKQQANENVIREIYQDQLEAHLAVLQKHQDEIEQIPKPDSALLAGLYFEPDETFNAEPVEYGPETKQEYDKDQAAREKLWPRYNIYKQDLRHVVKARGAAERKDVPELDPKEIKEDSEGKKKCPRCPKTLRPGAIRRHYQQFHLQDPCCAIYCPVENCNHVEWRGDSTIDDHLRKIHSLVLKENKTEEATGKTKGKAKIKINFTKPVSSEGHGGEVEQAEQAEKFQGGDGGDAKGNEMVDEEMADMEMMDEDTAGESMFVDDALDEDMDDVYS